MRKLCWFAVAFSVAIFATVYQVPYLALLMLPVGFYLKEHRKTRMTLVVLGLLLGLLFPCLYFNQVNQIPDGNTIFTATVIDYPYQTNWGYSLSVKVNTEQGAVKATVYGDDALATLGLGDSITGRATAKTNEMTRSQLGSYSVNEGQFTTLTLKNLYSVRSAESVPLTLLPLQWGQQVKELLFQIYGSDVVGLVTGVTTSDTGELSQYDYNNLRRAGLSHGVAVSGMHLGILVGAIGFFLGTNRRRTAWVCVPVLWVFTIFVGTSVSVVRASLMHSLLLVAPLMGRQRDSRTSLSFALMIILLMNPYSAGSVSLQLSFASTAGIILCTSRFVEYVMSYVQEWHRWLKKLAVVVATTLGISLPVMLFTAPLLLYHFGTMTLVSPLSNLLAFFGFAGLLFGGMLTVLCGAIYLPLGVLVSYPVSWLARYVLWVATWCSQVPYGVITAQNQLFMGWIWFVYIVVFVQWLRKGKHRVVLPISCALATFLMAVTVVNVSYQMPQSVVTALDVGQGQAVLFHQGDTTMLVDCGGDGCDAGERVADYLAERGEHMIDLLVLTHFDTDHVGGVVTLLDYVTVGTMAMPPYDVERSMEVELVEKALECGVELMVVTETQTLYLDHAKITLHRAYGSDNSNNSGISVEYESEGFNALCTGDMDDYIEERLVKYGDLPDVDLLMAGHHGSANCTSQCLLDAVTPEIVIFSVGENNYGHPDDGVMCRVAEMCCEMHRTDLEGDVTITIW